MWGLLVLACWLSRRIILELWLCRWYLFWCVILVYPPYSDGIHLDKQRIYVCTQRIITSKICKIFNHFKQTTLLLFYQHTIFKYIFNQTLYRSSLVIPQNMFIVTYFISACFKDMFVSANWRWRDRRVEIYRSYVMDCKHKL